MSARTKSRKRALDILYGADVRGVAIADLLGEEAERAEQRPERASSWPYARELVEGVAGELEQLDAAIEAHAQGWTLARMPALDRAIARLATWEILHNDEVPDGVAISEAVDFATSLSTDDSAGFLNGLLGAISRSKGDVRDALSRNVAFRDTSVLSVPRPSVTSVGCPRPRPPHPRSG